MDYLCELPNDAARRKALQSLPPDLNSTYERILSRVSQSPPETQELVRRALRWITGPTLSTLSTKALCEAVSVNLGSTSRDREAIPDEDDILRWCSSLVRKSADSNSLELAHFTVKEFLQQIDPNRDNLIGAYRIDGRADGIIRVKTCLTYLNYEDFNHSTPFSHQVVERRLEEYPFREHAITYIEYRVEGVLDDQDDDEIFSLFQKLLNPSKPNTFISWTHDMTALYLGMMNLKKEKNDESFVILNSGFSETSTLHWAAMLGLAKVCSWLIENGCDVNRDSIFGTPLHCALMSFDAIVKTFPDDYFGFTISDSAHNVADLLMEAGAETKCYHGAGNCSLSFLHIALGTHYYKPIIPLLDNGELLDTLWLAELEWALDQETDQEEICEIINHISFANVPPNLYGRLFRMNDTANTVSTTHLMKKISSLPLPKTHYEQMLRTAADLGQVEIVKRLLEDYKLDPNAADGRTGLTALHRAARTDQLVVVQTLMDHGADWSKIDGQGRTVLHYAAQGKGNCCLKFLLCQSTDASLQDLKGMKVRHMVGPEDKLQALSILPKRPGDLISMIGLKAKDGRTPLLHASTNQSEEAMRLLINAGSNFTDTALDGSTALHYAASSGSVEVVKFILGQKIDPAGVIHDGSSAIHCAIENNPENLAEILQILVENGVDPSQPRNDGCTPLGTIVRTIKSSFPGRLKSLFDASLVLLESLLDQSETTSNIKQGSELIYLACSLDFFDSAHETTLALLGLGLDCNIRFDGGRTALMAAAENGHVAILSTLLLHRADLSGDISGLTAVHCACLNDHEDVLVRLRGTSIDWNSKARFKLSGVEHANVTALHVAAEKESSKALRYLLNEDLMSDINARTSCGETPMWGAVRIRSPRNVSLLLSSGADTSCADSFGNTAIHLAAHDGDEDIFSEFTRNGLDMGLLNNFGVTPELVARQHNHLCLANTIMNYVNEQSGYHHSLLLIFCRFSKSIQMLAHTVRDRRQPTTRRNH